MKTYTLEQTNSKDLFRVVDRDGDWRFYYHKPSGKYLRAVNAILDEGYAKGARFYEYLKKISPEEADRKLKAAGDRGDAVHQAINILLTSGKVNRETWVLEENNRDRRVLTNDEWDCLLAFGEFWNRHEAQLIEKELAVCNIAYGYAGTLDCIAKLTKCCEVKSCPCKEFVGKVGLLDWKSSGGIYNSYGAQVAAYGSGDGIAVHYTAIVRIGTNHKTTGGYEFEPYDVSESVTHWEEFRAALTISNSEHKPFDPDKDIIEIPDSVSVNLASGKPKKPKAARKGIKVVKKKIKTDV